MFGHDLKTWNLAPRPSDYTAFRLSHKDLSHSDHLSQVMSITVKQSGG